MNRPCPEKRRIFQFMSTCISICPFVKVLTCSVFMFMQKCVKMYGQFSEKTKYVRVMVNYRMCNRKDVYIHYDIMKVCQTTRLQNCRPGIFFRVMGRHPTPVKSGKMHDRGHIWGQFSVNVVLYHFIFV